MKMSYEQLDVYQYALQLLRQLTRLSQAVKKDHRELSDQLFRASLSLSLNIAEGSGKSSKSEQKRFFGIARGSAMECGALIDALFVLELVSTQEAQEMKTLLTRIAAMLSALILR